MISVGIAVDSSWLGAPYAADLCRELDERVRPGDIAKYRVTGQRESNLKINFPRSWIEVRPTELVALLSLLTLTLDLGHSFLTLVLAENIQMFKKLLKHVHFSYAIFVNA